MPQLLDAPGRPRAVPGSSIATLPFVPEIPQKKLRNEVGEILRQAESGEVFTITVSGRPVAELGPLNPRRWVPSERLEALAKMPVDPTLARDLEDFDIEIRDPWER
jgi:prevent-host-death family protein